jgi:hypothetical protein
MTSQESGKLPEEDRGGEAEQEVLAPATPGAEALGASTSVAVDDDPESGPSDE